MKVEDKVWIRLAEERIAEASRYLSEVDWKALSGKEPGVLGSARLYLRNVYDKLNGLTNGQGKA